MKVLNMGTQKHTKIVIEDEPHPVNGANHEYAVISAKDPLGQNTSFARIIFQTGPVKEAGITGCHHEDLLNIVLHRLEAFQGGHGFYKCRENAQAITKIEEALHWLNHRTRKRESRGVEGTSAL